MVDILVSIQCDILNPDIKANGGVYVFAVSTGGNYFSCAFHLRNQDSASCTYFTTWKASQPLQGHAL